MESKTVIGKIHLSLSRQKRSSLDLFSLLTFILIFTSFYSSRLLADGGTMTGTGGGNAVACFENDSEANQALDDEGHLKSEFLGKIISLDVLDYWEADSAVHFFVPHNNETPFDFIHRVLRDEWNILTPHFVDRVNDALRIFETQWNQEKSKTANLSSDKIHLINDIGSLNRSLPLNCRLVGIVNRASNSIVGNYPNIHLNIYFELFEKLGMHSSDSMSVNQRVVLNQAILFLHEALYILGFEAEERDSHEIRAITRMLLSSNVLDSMKSLPENKHSYFIQYLETLLGPEKYLMLFSNEYPMNTQKISLQKSWLSIVKKLTECAKEWVGNRDVNKLQKDKNTFSALPYYMSETCLPENVNDEEAFLLAVHELSLNGMVNRAIFIASGVDISEELQKVCEKVNEASPLLPGQIKLNLKAKNYCNEYE